MKLPISPEGMKDIIKPEELTKMVPDVVEKIGTKVGQAIILNKILLIAKYVGIGIFIIIVLLIVYKIIKTMKK